MIFLLAFWLFLVGALIVGWQAGDRHDRRIVLAILAAAFATSLCHLLFADSTAILLVVCVDLSLLAIVVRYALSSGRYWPLWFAGFHGAGLAIGLLSLLPVGSYVVPLRIGAFWSLPALLAMSVGLLLDKRHGVAQPGVPSDEAVREYRSTKHRKLGTPEQIADTGGKVGSAARQR